MGVSDQAGWTIQGLEAVGTASLTGIAMRLGGWVSKKGCRGGKVGLFDTLTRLL